MQGPAPLRDAAHPMGCLALEGQIVQELRLPTNCITFLSDVVDICLSRSILIIIMENPYRSWFWFTTAFQRVAKRLKYRVCFDHCDGPRPKRSMLASSRDVVQHLQRNCPSEQCRSRHKPWGRTSQGFTMAEETIAKHVVSRALLSCRSLFPCKQRAGRPPVSSHATLGFLALCQSMPELLLCTLLQKSACRARPQRLPQAWPVPKQCSCALPAIPQRAQLYGKVRSQGNLDAEVKAKSRDEAEAGWLEGPFLEKDLSNSSLISKRFGLEQGTGESRKLRLVADFSSTTVNDGVQASESPNPHGVDVMAALSVPIVHAAAALRVHVWLQL